jgi:type VI secretion system protein ImpG
MDFEVYDVTRVLGSGAGAEAQQEFMPFYTRQNARRHSTDTAYFTIRRAPRLLSERQRRLGPRSSYIGSEVFLSLVDAREAPYSPDLRQLALTTLCTNRDLALHLTIAQDRNDFTLQSSAPLKSVHCVSGPTAPRPSHAEAETAWRLISQLSLNYLSLLDNDADQGAAALRDLLTLYGGEGEVERRQEVGGLRSVVSRQIMRRIPAAGPVAFGRGLEIVVTFDEAAFAGSGAFLLGSVLEQFFAKYVSINSFTETVVRTLQRGDVIRWPTRTGRRHSV